MKQIILLSVAICSSIGAYIPMLFGDTSFLSGWSILGGFIGGIVGVWLGVKIWKAWMS